MSSPSGYEAYATLATSNRFAAMAAVLGNSLALTRTTRPRICMVTEAVQHHALEMLEAVGFRIVKVRRIPNPHPDPGHWRLDVYTKLRAWNLLDYRKIVFLDADILVLRSLDALFELPELAATPDPGSPYLFASGMMVLEPSRETFEQMQASLARLRSVDRGDLGFLNSFFRSCWHELPYEYHVVKAPFYTERAIAFIEQHWNEISAIHFTAGKPGEIAPREDNALVSPHLLYLRSFDLAYREALRDTQARIGNLADLESMMKRPPRTAPSARIYRKALRALRRMLR